MRLPHTATISEIVEAIERSQARCRVNKIAAPLVLATHVRQALDAAGVMAKSINVRLRDLEPVGDWWEGHPNGDTTVVRVKSPWGFDAVQDVGIEVLRTGATVRQNGKLQLTLSAI